MLILERLSNFNETISYYKELLALINGLYPGITGEQFSKISSNLTSQENYLSAIRVAFMGRSLEVLQMEETLKNDHIDDNEINKIFQCMDSFGNIELLQEMDEREKIRQVRNCLAHGMYEICIKDENNLNPDADYLNFFIHIDNGKIRGNIDYLDIVQLNKAYNTIYEKVHPDKKIVAFKFNIKVLQSTKDSKKSLNTFINSISPPILSERKKAFLKEYIQYIGISQITQMPPVLLHLVLSHIINDKNGHDITCVNYFSEFTTSFIDTVRHFVFINSQQPYGLFSRDSLLRTNLATHTFEKPLLYANSLLGLANYCFLYAREVNKNSSNPIFNYYDLDIASILPASASSELIKTINPKDKIKNDLTSKCNSKKSLEKNIIKLQQNIEMLTNPNNKNPRKEELLQRYRIQFQELQKKVLDIDNQILQLKNQIENTSDKSCEDSSDFFRHMRNSIAHGNYLIDYHKFFNTKKLEDIAFCFEDSLDENSNYKFKINLSAFQLLQIFSTFQEKINQSIEQSSFGQINERRYLEEALLKRGISFFDIAHVSQDLHCTTVGDKGDEKNDNE